MKQKIILDLCGGTGSWSKPYQEAGYDVRIIDPLANGADVRLYKLDSTKVYGILAAPPCTHFAGSGARWWVGKGETALLEGLSVVDACIRIIFIKKPIFWVLENPVGRLNKYLGKPKMYFNPCDYGDPYTKKTCLWGDFNIPKKNPVDPIEGSKMHKLPPSPDRWRLRSMTPQGFAKAFFEANQ
jgi:site-specific DNA-cytosine methylase